MMRARPWLPFALAALSGCAAPFDAERGTIIDEAVLGQTVLFVGTDVATQSTNIYVVRALDRDADDERAPDLAEADEYQVDALTSLDAAGAGTPMQSDTDTLFTDDAPFAVPDRDGARVAFVATSYDEQGAPLAGRASVLDIAGGDLRVGGDVTGLRAAWFTWGGDWLVLERWNDDGRSELLGLPVQALGEQEPVLLGPAEPQLHLDWAGPLRDGNAFLALSTDWESGRTDAWRIDPESGESTLLTATLDGPASEPALSADGAWLALTRTDLETGARQVVVLDAAGSEDAPPAEAAPENGADCYWPSWSPLPGGPQRLAFVCSDPGSGRPDLFLWEAGKTQANAAESLTAMPQGIFDGTMDGLVLRSRPQWDPRGDFLVFGASTQESAYEGGGTTLAVLPLGGTAYPIYSGDEGAADWAHFSAAADRRNLLVWDRSATGLDDLGGDYPIHVVPTDDASPEPVPVRLGMNLRVSYPLYLGENTMLYP